MLEYGYVFAKDLRCSFVFDHLCYVQRHRPMGFLLQCGYLQTLHGESLFG